MNIEEITSYMYEQLNEDVSLEAVARHFHYSSSYFSRQFKKITGVTYRKYLESMRIQVSMRKFLMEEGNVTDVSGQVGYEYSSNFSKIFRKHTGGKAKGYKKNACVAYRLLRDFMDSKGSLWYRHLKDVDTQNRLEVSLLYPEGYKPELVFVGLFSEPLPNQVPIVGLATTNTESILLDKIPKGTYYLLACDTSTSASFFSTFIMLDNYRGIHDSPLIFEYQSTYTVYLFMEEPQPYHPLITVNLPKLVMDSLLKRSK